MGTCALLSRPSRECHATACFLLTSRVARRCAVPTRRGAEVLPGPQVAHGRRSVQTQLTPGRADRRTGAAQVERRDRVAAVRVAGEPDLLLRDRKSTRLN